MASRAAARRSRAISRPHGCQSIPRSERAYARGRSDAHFVRASSTRATTAARPRSSRPPRRELRCSFQPLTTRRRRDARATRSGPHYTAQRGRLCGLRAPAPRRGRPSWPRGRKAGLTPAEIAKKYGRDAAFELLSQPPLDTYAVAVPDRRDDNHHAVPGQASADLGLDLDHLEKAWAPRRSSPWSRTASSTC